MNIFQQILVFLNLSPMPIVHYKEPANNNASILDSEKNIFPWNLENINPSLLMIFVVAFVIDTVTVFMFVSKIWSIRLSGDGLLTDIQNLLGEVSKLKEEMHQETAKIQTKHEDFLTIMAKEMRIMAENTLSQNKIKENFAALTKKMDKVLLNKENKCSSMCQKIESTTVDIAGVSKRLETQNRYPCEKSIQTDLDSKVTTPKKSLLPKRKISGPLPMKLSKEGSKLRESVTATIRKSLMEFREGNLNFRNNEENEFVKLCDGIEQQILQASTSMTSLMEKKFEYIFKSNAVIMKCIKIFHDDTTQKVIEQTKYCLQYIYEHQERMAEDILKKVDVLMSSNQMLFLELSGIKQQNSDIAEKINSIVRKFGSGDMSPSQGRSQTNDLSSTDWDINLEEISLVHNSLCDSPEPENSTTDN